MVRMDSTYVHAIDLDTAPHSERRTGRVGVSRPAIQHR